MDFNPERGLCNTDDEVTASDRAPYEDAAIRFAQAFIGDHPGDAYAQRVLCTTVANGSTDTPEGRVAVMILPGGRRDPTERSRGQDDRKKPGGQR